MSSQDAVRNWLRNVLQPYPSRDRILQEVLAVLDARRTLSVKTDAFTFDNGQTALLLLLHGTLPITYRGARYHIPIQLWIPHEYPRVPPLAFVVPTKDMGVRKGREVDPGGRLREEVVEEWWRSWADKSIEMLLKQLTIVFSNTPPVYARAQQQPPQPSPSIPSSSRSPSGSYSNGRPPEASGSQPPPPPARPTSFPNMMPQDSLPQYRAAPTPPPHPYSQGPQSPQRQGSGSYRPQSISPPVPERPRPHVPPQMGHDPPPVPHRPYIPVQGQASPPPSQPPYGVQYRSPQQAPASPQPPIPSGQAWSQVHQAHPSQLQQSYTGPGAPIQPIQSSHPPPVVAPLQPQRPPDLLSSPEQTTSALPPDLSPSGDAPLPPSKPPPPSMLHLHSILLPHLDAALPSLVRSLQNNRQHLSDRHEDLESGEPAIRDEMARLEAVKKVCDSVGRKMDDVVAKGEARVAELEGRGEISVDEVVCGISIVHNQLIDLVAEDNAIEDTIFHMTRALDAERIDLDRFLKSIRTLAREQYMKRALIERICEGMGQKPDW